MQMSYVNICKTQIDVQFSNIWPFFTFSNRRPMTSLVYTSNDVTPLGNVFEAMMEKGQDQIPDEGFLMPMYYSYCR
jgi:branched-subunit amino acid transport protein AzlD